MKKITTKQRVPKKAPMSGKVLIGGLAILIAVPVLVVATCWSNPDLCGEGEGHFIELRSKKVETDDIRISDDSEPVTVEYSASDLWYSFDFSMILDANEKYEDSYTRKLNDYAKLQDGNTAPCFGVRGGDTELYDITFDISGSVVNQLAVTDIGYRHAVQDEIEELLLHSSLMPGDVIRVHFLGANEHVLTDEKREFVFAGPQLLCKFTYQEFSRTTFIDVLGPVDEADVASNLVTNPKELNNAIRKYYAETLALSDVIGNDTFLVEHLRRIKRDLRNGLQFSRVTYIIQTDGHFSNPHKLSYPDLTVSEDGSDEVIVLGLNRTVADGARLEDVLVKVFDPIEVKFLE